MYLTMCMKNGWQSRSPKRKARGERNFCEKGLGHGITQYLRFIRFPAIGNFDHLHAEYQVRDFNNGYRYLDLAFMPGDAKVLILKCRISEVMPEI